MYFVNQKKHKSANDTWDNNVHVRETLNEAFHQFHAFLSTYGYGQDQTVDYTSCSIENMNGSIIRNEVDDRIPQPEPEPTPEPETEE